MPQLHFSVSDQLADRIRQNAESAGLSTSQYLAQLIENSLRREWPAGFFENVVGGWQGEPLERSEQGDFEGRDSILFEGDFISKGSTP
jgi:hypothetical protein